MRRSYFAPTSFSLINILINLVPVWHLSIQAKMVEAPGTAPGSALLISQHVYRHSWQASILNIRAGGVFGSAVLQDGQLAVIGEYPIACLIARDVACVCKADPP